MLGGFGPTRDVGQRDMIPAAAWDRSDALRPAELSHIAHATIGPGHSGGQTGAEAKATDRSA